MQSQPGDAELLAFVRVHPWNPTVLIAQCLSVWPSQRLWPCRTGCPQRGVKAIPREAHMELGPKHSTTQAGHQGWSTMLLWVSVSSTGMKGIGADKCRDSFLLQMHESVSSYSFMCVCSVPSTVLAITYILSNIPEWTHTE